MRWLDSLPRMRVLAAVVGVFVVILLGWLWLRDSGLVAVRDVTITGVSGSDAKRVRAALEDAARDMTTLHVRDDQLKTAVAPFASVQAVEARADFPHGLDIVVHERVAVGAMTAGSGRVAVAADGTFLREVPTDKLPVIPGAGVAAGDRLDDAKARRAIDILAAASAALRDKVTRIYVGKRGYTMPLRNGPVLYFGGSTRVTAKWAATAIVLADKSSAGATYLDVRLPERPAAGGLEQPPELQPQAGLEP